MKKLLFKRILFLLLPLAVTLVAVTFSRFDAAALLELKLLDARFRLRGPEAVEQSPFQIVAIDDQTFRALNRKWPLDASLYARLIRNLNRAGAREIVFDIEFSEPDVNHLAADSLLAQTIRDAGNVVLSYKMEYASSSFVEGTYSVKVPPHSLLEETGAPEGLVNDITDPDNVSRRALLYLPVQQRLEPSLVSEVLRTAQDSADSISLVCRATECTVGQFIIPRYNANTFLINYYGPAGTFPAISFSSVLDDVDFDLDPSFDSNYLDRILSADVINPFQDKIVLVGASAADLHDLKHTPFDTPENGAPLMSGVEVYAHALQTCWDSAFIRRTSPALMFLVSLLIAVLAFICLRVLKPLIGAFLSLISAPVIAAVSLWLFVRFNIWFDLVAPLLTLTLSVLTASLYYYVREKREKLKIREMFHHYIPDDLMRELLDNPSLLRLGGERRRVTILFADLENFTSLCEWMVPEEMVAMLNDYMSVMTDVIRNEGGMIDKYEGDLIMAEFGAPVPYADHAERACRAALNMQNELNRLQSRWQREGKPAIRLRIGINTGAVIVGNMGSKDLFDYTVLGDAVNLCSRLEVLNKTYKTRILISQSTRDDLLPQFVTRKLGDLPIRGRRSSVCVFELIAASPLELDTAETTFMDTYRRARLYFERRNWDKAAASFTEALRYRPDDVPAKRYLRQCRKQIDALPESPSEITACDEVL